MVIYNPRKQRKVYMIIGVILVLIGLLMPLIITTQNLHIYPMILKSLREKETGYLAYAALLLVILNAVRSIPHYLGAFFIRESLQPEPKGLLQKLLRTFAVCGIVPIIYFLIYQIHGIRYDFGVPAISLILMLFMFEKTDFSFVNLPKKVLMVITLILAVQFLDIMPALSQFPIGRGDASREIKLVAEYLDVERFLQGWATILFALLLFSSILLWKMIIDEHYLKLTIDENKRVRQVLLQERMRALEERTQLELQHLVHDLKSPLTAAQALVSVTKMMYERDYEPQQVEYLSRVESSMETMSAMISEILYETKQSLVATEGLVNQVLAQISNTDYVHLVRTENNIPTAKIEINEIRVVRALINLIENAYYALNRNKTRIILRVDHVIREEISWIQIQVEDKGQGIPVDELEKVWEEGYSTRASSGLGLSFIRQVIEGNYGEIEIQSQLEKGTKVTIYLPQHPQERLKEYES